MRILIVEDDPMIADIYQKKFAEAGHEVFMASSGDQALVSAKENKPEIVLLDLIMPKMDGFEVIKNLRAGGYDPGLKVIVFSNLSQTEEREKAAALGADGFVGKSDFTPSNLVKEVERLMKQV